MTSSPSKTSYSNAPTRLVKLSQYSLAIREAGKDQGGVPILLLNHWGANLDDFDPRIIDELAKTHHVIAANYRGVGSSTGTQRVSVHLIALDIIELIKVLGFGQIDLFGFSLGGHVSQEITLLEPNLIRKLVLVGTEPHGFKGVLTFLKVPWLLLKSLFSFNNPKRFLFFPPNRLGKTAAKEFLSAIETRKSKQEPRPSLLLYILQLIALARHDITKPKDLSKIKQPTLIVNGDKDLMIPSKGSYDLHRRIKGSQLIIYPNSGHGSHFQNYQDFTSKLLLFLK